MDDTGPGLPVSASLCKFVDEKHVPPTARRRKQSEMELALDRVRTGQQRGCCPSVWRALYNGHSSRQGIRNGQSSTLKRGGEEGRQCGFVFPRNPYLFHKERAHCSGRAEHCHFGLCLAQPLARYMQLVTHFLELGNTNPRLIIAQICKTHTSDWAEMLCSGAAPPFACTPRASHSPRSPPWPRRVPSALSRPQPRAPPLAAPVLQSSSPASAAPPVDNEPH